MRHRSINVILVDDASIIHHALDIEFKGHRRIRLVATARTGVEALSLFGRVRADIALIDMLMPEISGFEIAHAAMRADPKLRILFFSALNTRAFVEHARQIGAAGWVVKDCITDLIAAIEKVVAGAPFIAPDESHPPTMIPSVDERNIPTEGKQALTPREIEILRLTVDSHEVKEIATRLGISIRTVEVHRQHIFQKLHTRSIADLTKFAIVHGYTSL